MAVNSSDDGTEAPPGGWPVPQSAYIHVPFCRHRCGYCNFSVVAGRDDLVDRFLTAIDRELAALEKPHIETLFIGGGTPTHLSPAQLTRFFDSLNERFRIASACEWSVEANPEDIDAQTLQLLVDHGVNRVSLGVQSFNEQKLRILERSHTGRIAQSVVEQVAKTINNVSIDLIFAAPNETIEVWQQDVSTALSLPIQHLSTYALTFEKGTSFWTRQRKGELRSLDETTELDMYQHVRRECQAKEFAQYEVSNFSTADHPCRHNVAYWQGRGWFAAGPGAAAFVNGVRSVNHRSTTTYLHRVEAGQSPVAESDSISKLQYARERAAFGIRMIDGIDLDQLSSETGVDLNVECKDAIEQSIADELLTVTDNHAQLTERGVLFADTVASAFLG